MAELSTRGTLLLNAFRKNFDLLKEHEKVSVGEVNFIVEAIASHIRSWKSLGYALPNTPEKPDGR